MQCSWLKSLRNVSEEFVRVGKVESGTSRELFIKRRKPFSKSPKFVSDVRLGAEQAGGKKVDLGGLARG
jgi:hypothetical protein